jgi:hypothetical protein
MPFNYRSHPHLLLADVLRQLLYIRPGGPRSTPMQGRLNVFTQLLAQSSGAQRLYAGQVPQ